VTDDRENIAPTFAESWQLPVLLLAVALFGFGLYLAMPESAGEQYGDAMQKVRAMVVAGQYTQAIDVLDRMTELEPEFPQAIRGQYHLLVADTLYLAQKSRQWDQPLNHQRILDRYHRAQELGQMLDDDQYERMINTLVAVGRTDEALTLLNERGDAGADMRQKLIQKLVRQALDERPVAVENAQQLIDQLLAEKGLSREREIWAIAREGELLMRRDQVKQAVDMLLRRIARLQADGATGLGELMVQLGQAYLADGGPADAERWLMRGRQALSPEDALNGQVLVALGRIRFAEDNIVEALEHYSDVVAQFTSTQAYPPALIGKAECQARLGVHDQAMADYAKAVELFGTDPAGNSQPKAHLVESLMTQYELRFGQGDFELALSYLDMARKLYAPPLPAEMQLKLAIAHEQLARQMLGLADGEQETTADWRKLDRGRRLEVARHFASAADFYLDHARAVTVSDDDAYGRSLWKAGEYYDKAGLHKQAIAVFGEFVQARPDDPKRLAAMFRLAQAHQADGQFDEAIKMYKQLIDQNPKSPEAYASLVPLARSYIAMGPKYTDLAEHVLLSVVTDHPALRPESAEYREALTELGQLYYRRGAEGDYEKAIARLDEVVERYGQGEGPAQMPELMFQLGDAYRKSVQQIDEKLSSSLPPSQAADLRQKRAYRLDRAQRSFNSVINAFEDRGADTLSELQKLYLRNSFFYRADCAYELGRYEGPDGAIALYEKAVQRYDKDPAALVALVQMVNSYCELGRWDMARAVNERAKVYLQRIPESAFDDPNLPMNRKHWQRWLDWTSQMAMTSAAATPPQ
jgi:tetratricopeptide (TPR) repeat protein